MQLITGVNFSRSYYTSLGKRDDDERNKGVPVLWRTDSSGGLEMQALRVESCRLRQACCESVQDTSYVRNSTWNRVVVVGAGSVENLKRTGTLSGKGLTEAGVTNIEHNINVEFSERPGVRVEQVKMLRESPTQMTGFVKLRLPLLGELQKSCNAKLVEGGQTLWQCE